MEIHGQLHGNYMLKIKANYHVPPAPEANSRRMPHVPPAPEACRRITINYMSFRFRRTHVRLIEPTYNKTTAFASGAGGCR